MSLPNKAYLLEEEDCEAFSPLRIQRDKTEVQPDIFVINSNEENIITVKKSAFDSVKTITSRNIISSTPELYENLRQKSSTPNSKLTSPKNSKNGNSFKRLSLNLSNLTIKKKLFAPSPTKQELDTYSSERRKASVEIMNLKEILN